MLKRILVIAALAFSLPALADSNAPWGSAKDLDSTMQNKRSSSIPPPARWKG